MQLIISATNSSHVNWKNASHARKNLEMHTEYLLANLNVRQRFIITEW